jgi:hypothetical protein
MRKTCAILHDCFGLQFNPGGFSQDLDRLAAKVKPNTTWIMEAGVPTLRIEINR